jgi:hypothetical protein
MNMYLDHDGSKKPLFRATCGGCGKKLRKQEYYRVGFLCNECGPRAKKIKDDFACMSCRFQVDCIARAFVGIWVRCEMPDRADIERLNSIGGFDAQVEDRSILEKKVSQEAAKIYQMRINGIKGKSR